jgi:uncharacterized protein
VVLGANHQGQRLGQLLYAELFEFAKGCGCSHVAAEFDVEPPNEVSRRFHASLDFIEVGTQYLAGPRKLVSMQLANVIR